MDAVTRRHQESDETMPRVQRPAGPTRGRPVPSWAHSCQLSGTELPWHLIDAS